MRRSSGLAWVVLSAVLVAPGCQCFLDCFKSAPIPPPSTAHQGVVVICRMNDPNKPIAYVSYDPANSMHMWWLVRSDEQAIPIQNMVSGQVPPSSKLMWTPVTMEFTNGTQLCQNYKANLMNGSEPPILIDVLETQSELSCQ